ncbi:hypothetical protein Tco_0573335 [Tanacetum coccineum]
MKVINMVGSEGNCKRPYEMERIRMTEEIAFLEIPWSSLIDAPIILEGSIEGYHVRRIYVDGGSSSDIMFLGETYHPLGLIDLRVTMGEPGKSKIMLLEFAIVKCCSTYHVIMGRTGMRSLEAVGSTIHSMIKFPMAKGVATMRTNREAIWKCRQIDRMHSSWKETSGVSIESKCPELGNKQYYRLEAFPTKGSERN